ncbi:MAG TPA: 50S ribosomal protein L6 [Anaerolineales bacterium]|nr:50S ribosomal protein L6 [Anaerolineales bacterium]
MSRIGRLPVDIPNGVQVNLDGSNVIVKGPKGEMKRVFSSLIGITLENNQLNFTRNSEEPAERALHGTTRAVLANMIHGVSKGFTVILEVEGVGYRAEMDGKNLALHVGYSHPVKMEPPTGVSFETDAKTRQIKVLGFDKELVGQIAANIRKVRPPEPYHGKGIRYQGEKIRRKAGKAGKGAK